jgi:hypothetical protein
MRYRRPTAQGQHPSQPPKDEPKPMHKTANACMKTSWYRYERMQPDHENHDLVFLYQQR